MKVACGTGLKKMIRRSLLLVLSLRCLLDIQRKMLKKHLNMSLEFKSKTWK